MKRYGQWAGDPKGKPENSEHCVKEVWPPVGWVTQQCSRKRGYGEDGLYCKQHAKRHPAKETPAP